MREACVKHVADAIAACYRRAWTSPDEMRGATGALKRLAVSMANLPLPPAPAASGDGPRAADASRIECVGCDAPSSCRDADGKPLCAACAETCLAPAASAPADDAVARAREEALAVEPDALVNAIMGSDLVRLYGIKSIEVARYHARQITRVYRALAAERAAKGGEKEATQGTCSRCGYLAMPPACTKCYSPYPAPAPRDGGAKGGSEGGERG